MSLHRQGVQMSLSWMPAYNGQVPYNAIPAGDNVYIVRGRIGNDVVPGKLPTGHTTAYLPYDCRENPISDYEVLVDTGLHKFGAEVEWKTMSGGYIPRGAVIGGVSADGEALYVARSRIKGEVVVGKVHGSHQCAYFPWGGKEHKHNSYQVLRFVGH